MPMGKFKDFDACVTSMKGKGHDENEAKKMCGSMKKKMEAGPRKIVYESPSFKFESVKKDDGNDDLMVHGVAINETTTRNNVKYTSTELAKSAQSLVGKPILKDHDARVDNIVGEVTNALFEGSRISYTGRIMDKGMKEKINAGLIKNVSIGAAVSELVNDETEEGVMVAKGIDFMELSLVACPGDKNATITHAIMEAFQTETDDDEEEYLDEKSQSTLETVKEANSMETQEALKELEELRAFKKAKENEAVNNLIEEVLASDTGWTREELAGMPVLALKKISEKAKLQEGKKPTGRGKGEVTTESETRTEPFHLKNGLNVLKIREGGKTSLTIEANDAYRKKFFPYAN